MVEIPDGYRIEREEHPETAISGPEISFLVIDVMDSEREVVKTVVRGPRPRPAGRELGDWYIAPGGMVGQFDAGEARARAAAYLMAAEELELRTGQSA